MAPSKRRRTGDSGSSGRDDSSTGRSVPPRRREAVGSLAIKIRHAESAYADLRRKIEQSGGSDPGSNSWQIGGDSRLEITHQDLEVIGRLLAEARGASAALSGFLPSVDEIVLATIAEWAGFNDPADVLPGDNVLCDLLRVGRGIECSEDARALLIGQLQASFPGALSQVRARDLAPKGALATVDALLNFVAARV